MLSTEKLFSMFTPSIFRQLLRAILGSRQMVSPPPVISEDDLCRLAAIQLEVVSHGPSLQIVSSACLVVSLLAEMMMYVSSAYLHIELLGTAATRSLVVTTYEAGPIADPWIIPVSYTHLTLPTNREV